MSGADSQKEKGDIMFRILTCYSAPLSAASWLFWQATRHIRRLHRQPNSTNLIEMHIGALGGRAVLANPATLVLSGDCEASNRQTNPDRAGSGLLFIDRQSGLLVRDELMPGLVFTFSDYREIQGVQVPFSIKQTGPASASYTYSIQKASRIATTDDSRFKP